jgi:threonine synthase
MAEPLELDTWSAPALPWPASGGGLWRFLPWLPLEQEISLGEPETPLVQVRLPRGGAVTCKLEGALPTGSFKDRGSAALVSHLAGAGVRGIAVDSSGNAGASLAAYCAKAGLTARVYVPATASRAKLVQIEAYGAELVPVAGSRADVADAAAADSDGLVYASHIWNPYFMVGTQTFAFELVAQLGGAAPGTVVFPLGAGTLLLGSYYGFRALLKAGLTNRMPRIVGVEAEACAPFRAAWTGGTATGCGTSLAEGLLIASPPRLDAVVAAVRETGGEILSVSEAEIARAVLELARQGVYAEPSAAVAYAGASTAGAEGETVLALTATGLKTTAQIDALL